MKAVIDYEELENFLAYLEDKTEDVYQKEVRQAIEQFKKEQITTMTSDLIK